MKRIHKLRRLAVIILALCSGMLLGQFSNSFVIVSLVLAFILWLLAYDFATEEQYRKVRNNDVKSRTESSRSRIG